MSCLKRINKVSNTELGYGFPLGTYCETANAAKHLIKGTKYPTAPSKLQSLSSLHRFIWALVLRLGA